MSTMWGYRCLDCGHDSEQPFNHGQDILREIVAGWPHYLRLRDYANGLAFDVSVGGYGLGEFLEQHHGHSLTLLDEYGGTEPVQLPAEVDEPTVVDAPGD
jgi:hypothetical protein